VKLGQLFEKDPLKRIAGAGELVNEWKGQYRKMM